MLKTELIETLDDVEEILGDDSLSDSEKISQLEDMFFEPEPEETD